MKRAEKTVFSDVLVVGGAGAAVMSAVRAAQKGASVALVSKGKVGKSGNTIMIGGGFGIDGEGAREYCGEAEADQTYTKDRVFRKLAASGFYLGDQKLQKVFAEKAPAAVADCLKWAKNAGQLFAFNPKSCTWRTSGASFGKAVREGLRESPAVAVYEDVMIVDLLTNAGAVCGALGIDVYTGELIRYHAKAVILATGGYQPFSLKNSNSDMAGDGIAMALRAGASVTDMEFLLFIGTVLEPYYARGSILPFLLTIPALSSIKPKVTDLDGKELVYPPDEKYKIKPTDSKVNKLLMAYFYGRGIFEKTDTYGNAFYYDYSAYSDEEIRQGFGSFAEKQKKWHREGMYNGIDLRRLTEDIIRNKKRLKVGFGNEYSMGGVVVAPDFSTGVPGLYAAGEVTGGTFGAFRSGDGLTEMLTHGAVAGASAAAYAEKAEQFPADDLREKEEAVFAPFEKAGGISPIEARRELEHICDRGFDFFRDGKHLQEAYDRILELRGSLKDLSVANRDFKYNLEWINFFLVRNLALCAEIGIYSALNRRESRGTHLRADYPEVNNREYLFNWVAKIEDGQIRYEKHRPQADFIAAPVENAPSIPDYIVKNILEDS